MKTSQKDMNFSSSARRGPTKTAGPRLKLRKRSNREPTYIIYHGQKQIFTGTNDYDKAISCLDVYIKTIRSGTSYHQGLDTKISDVIARSSEVIRRSYQSLSDKSFGRIIRNISRYWGRKTLKEIDKNTCLEYISARQKRRANGIVISNGSIRLEMQIFSQCVTGFMRSNDIRFKITIFMPERGKPRSVFATRSEMARLLRAIRNQRSEAKKLDTWIRPDQTLVKSKIVEPEIAEAISRFVLLGVYTATRRQSMLKVRWEAYSEGGHIDFKDSLFYRKGKGERLTKKGGPPVRLCPAILGHLRRWKNKDRINGHQYVIHDAEGRPLSISLVAWRLERACTSAGIDKNITPHALRHTSITWVLSGGATVEEAAEFAGCTKIEIERTYGEVCTKFSVEAAEALAHFGRL